MEAKTTKASDNSTPAQAFHAHFHTGRRLRKLLRPSGRRVHIAATPEEHIHLKRYVNLKSHLESFRPIEISDGREYRPRLLTSGKHSDYEIVFAVLCQTLNQMTISTVTSMVRQST